MGRWWRVVVLRLTMRPSRSKRLAVSTVEHGLFSLSRIVAVRPIIRLARHGSAGGARSIDGIGRNEGSLR